MSLLKVSIRSGLVWVQLGLYIGLETKIKIVSNPYRLKFNYIKLFYSHLII